MDVYSTWAWFLPACGPVSGCVPHMHQAKHTACVSLQELGWREIKERYVRPSYLPASFTLGALTIGLRLGAANYTFSDSVSVSKLPQDCFCMDILTCCSSKSARW
jgi:hypothetical protein